MVIGGGQRTGKLSPSQYAEVVRRSQIGVNFPLSQAGVFWQAKGRIFEYTACGALLFDMKNPATSDFFVPGADFVEFENFDDLSDKLKHYLNNPEERLKIAQSGHRKFKENYTAKTFWSTILNKINQNKNE